MTGYSLRDATPDDASAIAAIYAPFVTDTAISFEETPPTAADIAARIAQTQKGYPYLVAESDGRVVAYAYAGAYRTRHAYRFTAEVTAYAHEAGRGHGIGAALYDEVLARLTGAGFHTAVAIITLPNEASVRFHERMGFRHVGTIAEVGHKFDQWHDTGIWQRDLGRGTLG